jgi:glyoxylase-like metal-dependent hydrolase (beta-lactamase superfamily II)
MGNLELISEHIAVDTTTQVGSRSCVLSGISLENYSIAIDSGYSLETGTALREGLETHFKCPVKYLFFTHTHNDHRNGREPFSDCTFLMSQQCRENMPKSVRLSKIAVETFEEKFTLKEDDLSVEFIRVGGHSIGFSIAYFPKEKVLFGGDLFIVGSVNFGLPFMSFYQNKPKRTGNPEEYLAAFELFKQMDLEVIVPGHGDLVLEPKEYLKAQTKFFEDLKKHIISAIEEGKNEENIEMPKLQPIIEAYEDAENRKPRSKAIKFLDHYLNVLKNSFYNYYSGKFEQMLLK